MRHIIFTLLCMLSLAAQAQRVSHNFKNAKLAEVLTTLSEESKDYDIVFIHNDLENCRVTTRFSNLSIPEAVANVTAEQPVKVKRKGRSILVQYKKSKDRKAFIYGQARNNITREPVKNLKVTMLNADSVEISSALMPERVKVASDDYCWFVQVPMRIGERIIRFDAEGYESMSIRVPATTFSSRNPVKYISPIYMRRKMREVMLGEVVVKATKVKFAYRGDTLVYNADAFQLSEGSMLDALIRQLPGAVLKDNGQILVNGKVVESLLLNGEDFFSKNRQIMLDNLPSYMVQNVKVYERQDEVAKAMGRKTGDETYVMDVQLKRQYNTGWIANVEAGGGSDERWLARAFALRFTNHSRLSAFANMNNLNDSRKPGEDTGWTPDKMPAGRQTMRQVGLDYLSKERDEAYKFQGDLVLEHADAEMDSRTSAVNFLPEQNTWTRGGMQTNSHNMGLTTSHKMYFRTSRRHIVNVNPSANYKKWDNRAASVSATFNGNPALSVSDPKALLDSVRQMNSGSLLSSLAVNRYLNETTTEGHSVKAGVNADWTYFTTSACIDHLQLNANVDYSYNCQSIFTHYLLDYPSVPAAASDYRNKYVNDRPNRWFNYALGLSFQHWLGGDNNLITPSYTFGQTFRSHDYALYRLDQLAGFDKDNAPEIGTLPSEQEYQQTVDVQNSFMQDITDTYHKFALDIGSGHHMSDDHDYQISINLPLTLTNTSMDYRRAAYSGRSTRTTLFFEPSVELARVWHAQQRNVYFNYNLTMSSPDMTRLLDIEDNADPLRISTGNPGLKNTAHHLFRIGGVNNSRRKQRSFYIYLKYQLTQNAVAMGYTYNQQTGVRRYRPYNVNGNYRWDSEMHFSTPLDRQKLLVIDTHTGFKYIHNVDLIGIDRTTGQGSTGTENTDMAPVRSSVNTLTLNERIKLEYRLGKTTMGLSGYAGWNNARSKREGFVNQDVWTFNYGPTLKMELPWNMQLSTDLTVYSNRGFSDSSANTDDVVWNARLSKRFMGSRLTLAVDGFDILGQLSNITYTMNSQGLTETWRNSLPRYVMVHAIWRFSKQPKKF